MKYLIITSLLFLSSLCHAQNWREYLNGQVSYVSQYIWRGMDIEKHSAFAQLDFNYKGLKVSGEYGAAFSGDYMETVLSVGYTYNEFTLSVRDQYFPIYKGVKSTDYFNWKPEESYHQMEVVLKYAPKDVPLRFMWSTYVLGYDLKYQFDKDGNFTWGDRAYSSYLEMTAFHKFPKMHTIAGTMGFSVNKGLYTAYQADFALVNTQVSYTKTWVWKGMYPSVGAYCVFNPYKGKFYPVAYASVAF